MDDQRFDAALRALQAGTTRRAGLAGALGVLLGGRSGALAEDAAHKRRDANRGQAGKESGTWSYSTKFGTFGSNSDQFSQPWNLVVSADGLTAWVADRSNHRISIWTRLDTSSTIWSPSTQFGTVGSGDSNFRAPTGVFVSADTRTAWVADTNNNRISIWTRPSTTSKTWTYSAQFGTFGSNSDQFSYPYNLVVSADGLTAWVADRSNHRISIWTRPDISSTTWSPSTQFGSGPAEGKDSFKLPYGVFVSADSLTAWVADPRNNRISIWTRPSTTSKNWSYSAQFGTLGHGNSNFRYPRGVFVSGDSRTAWVADDENSRISIWTRPSTTSKTWSYSAQFGTKGSGNHNFRYPSGVFVSADARTAWVADSGTRRISIWTKS